MNPWLKLSIQYASQRSYLDDLFRVYPTIPEGIRYIDGAVWENAVSAFNENIMSSLVLREFLYQV